MNEESTYDIRIPERYLAMLNAGEITPAMLLTLTVLYKWANWAKGRVKQCSAGGLRTWTNKAYSERTFSEALRKLELMGEITRHMKPGSTKDYAVTLHNYKVYDDAGKVQMINPKARLTWAEVQKAQCEEASEQRSDEGSEHTSEQTSEQGSDKVLSETESENQSETESENKSQNDLDRKSDRQPTAAAPPPSVFSDDALYLLKVIKPIRNAGEEAGDLSLLDQALKLLPEYINPLYLLEYNQRHKTGGLVIRSAQQYLDAVQGKNGEYHLLNEYWNHVPLGCRVCKQYGITVSAESIWATKKNREADNALREAEAAREKALISAGYNFDPITDWERVEFKQLQGEGWERFAIGRKVDSGEWQRKHADAAIRQQIKIGTPISFDAFAYLVEEIKTLDTPVAQQINDAMDVEAEEV